MGGGSSSGSSTADDVIYNVIGVLFEFHVGWHILVDVRDEQQEEDGAEDASLDHAGCCPGSLDMLVHE